MDFERVLLQLINWSVNSTNYVPFKKYVWTSVSCSDVHCLTKIFSIKVNLHEQS